MNVPSKIISVEQMIQEFRAKRDGGEVTSIGAGGVVEVVAQYEGVESGLRRIEELVTRVASNFTVGTQFLRTSLPKNIGSKAAEIKKELNRNYWRELIKLLDIERIAPSRDMQALEAMLEGDCPEFCMNEIEIRLIKYGLNPREHMLRGLAETFCSLDPFFKSHEKMKIGVKGLPKRIIISNCSETYGRYSGWNKILDVLKAIAVYRGAPLPGFKTIRDMYDCSNALSIEGKYGHNFTIREGEIWKRGEQYFKRKKREVHDEWNSDDWELVNVNRFFGMSVKLFNNGNGHLYFSPDVLTDVNRALAEFYGEVLPDCPEEKPAKERASTQVSKDLQFYPSPDDVVDKLIWFAHPYLMQQEEGFSVLEPSIGEGAIIQGLLRWSHEAGKSFSHLGYEIDGARVETCKRAGLNVIRANFLDVEPQQNFDVVLMNPPYFGKHYQKHIKMALRHLKPSGKLFCILPITAKEDHGFVPDVPYGRNWMDLPVGSFSSSGTNINTGIAVFSAS